MREDGRKEHRRPRLFIAVCWIPAAVMIAMLARIRSYEGWGAWAAAQALLIPVILSGAMLVFGSIVSIALFRAGRLDRMTATATLIAGGPALWFLWRVLTV